VNKGLIFEIRRFTVHDGPGIRTTVFFKGCPLSCWWCHNPESQSNQPEEVIKTFTLDGNTFYLKEMIGQWMAVDEVMRELRMDRIFYNESSGGVTFSGGEPLMQADFLLELLKDCKTNSIHTTIDTSGFGDSKNLKKLLPYTDLFLYDLKLMDDKAHIKLTGVSNRIILENLVFLVSEEKQVIIRIPIIPSITDTPQNIMEIKEFLAVLAKDSKQKAPFSINLLPYHSIAKNKYLRLSIENKTGHLKDIAKDSLMPLKEELEAEGFFVKIGG
jgi:pyruvate formate lyase activating enzyme